MSCQIVYVNSTHENLRYVREAQASAESFRRFIPNATYTLVTDAKASDLAPFDEIRAAVFEVPANLAGTTHKNGQMVAKLRALPELQHDRVMYLGSDTYALRAEVAGMFDLLDQFDVVAAHAPLRVNTTRGNSAIPEIPACYPEFNCDVIVYRNSPAVRLFLEQWRDLYLDHAFGHPHDQGAFRYLLYNCELRVATLPEEYNYRGKRWRPGTVHCRTASYCRITCVGNVHPRSTTPDGGRSIWPGSR